MKQLGPNTTRGALPQGRGGTPSLAEIKALRLAQKATNQRVEELKLRLLQLSEKHMDQVVMVIRQLLAKEESK